MHQKDAARQAWTKAGLYQTKDEKLLQFLSMLDDAPTSCWPELIEQCRTQYAQYKGQLVEPLWQSGDKLLRLNLIRAADQTREDEAALLAKFADSTDPARDQPELRAMAARGDTQLLGALQKKPNLPPDIHAVIVDRVASLERQSKPPAGAGPTKPTPTPKSRGK